MTTLAPDPATEARVQAAEEADPSDDDAGTPSSLRLFLREVGRRPLLSEADEVALAQRIERGDEGAKRRMIESNLRLVVAVAKQYRGLGVPFLDLIQEGSIGLTRAAERFDWRRGCRFSTYATFWIRQSVHRAVNTQGRAIRLPVGVYERRRALDDARRSLATELGHAPSDAEVASVTGIPGDRARRALEAPEVTTSLDAPIGGDDLRLLDLVADTDGGASEEDLDAGKREREVQAALATLPDRYREVLERRFGFDDEPMTLDEVAEEFGIVRERVRQIEAQAIARLARSHRLDAFA